MGEEHCEGCAKGAEFRRRLAELIEEYACFLSEAPVIVTDALLVWDQTRFDEDGDRSIANKYVLTHDGTFSGALGLARAGQLLLEHDYARTLSDE